MDLRTEAQAWIADDPDPHTAAQVQAWLDTNNEVELKGSFAGFLQFGTAGLRGPVRPRKTSARNFLPLPLISYERTFPE